MKSKIVHFGQPDFTSGSHLLDSQKTSKCIYMYIHWSLTYTTVQMDFFGHKSDTKLISIIFYLIIFNTLAHL